MTSSRRGGKDLHFRQGQEKHCCSLLFYLSGCSGLLLFMIFLKIKGWPFWSWCSYLSFLFHTHSLLCYYANSANCTLTEQPSTASDSERKAARPLSMSLGPSRADHCLTVQHTGRSFVLAASAYRQQPEHKVLSNLLQAPATSSVFSLLGSSLEWACSGWSV